jgi:hypothetical protein
LNGKTGMGAQWIARNHSITPTLYDPASRAFVDGGCSSAPNLEPIELSKNVDQAEKFHFAKDRGSTFPSGRQSYRQKAEEVARRSRSGPLAP